MWCIAITKMVKTVGLKKVTQGIVLSPLNNNPTSQLGKFYYNNISKKFLIFNGTAYREVGA